MKVTIPQGYIIEITTWENDGDNYKTKKIDGLSKEKCLFYKKVAESFYSTNSKKKGFGNDDWSYVYKQLKNIFGEDFKKLCCDHNETEDEINKYLTDWISDHFYDIIGTWNDGEYWRVVDNYEIYYASEVIEYELCDVDSELNPKNSV